ncbi:hypothetical protein LSCM1_03042 [Leishmania martiniquensis]|uniref:Uncharacterized protein n=1 Tax=Leishmania martiniquensis TaxID=1580590 RepID=A0A836KQA9_9TRYP|nr:hypothetical protein LSCM1_03042 [Leishmania martiniquensis]
MNADTPSPACASVRLGGDTAAGTSQSVYAARPRWSHDDDDSVTVVQSTQDYTQRIFRTKPPSALWVRGLRDGEEDNVARGFRRSHGGVNEWKGLDDTADELLQEAVYAETWRRQWLLYPNALAIAYFCLMVVRMMSGLHRSYRLDYPTAPWQLELYGRRYGENGASFLMRVFVPLAGPHVVGAAYALSLTYMIGGAAHNFIALCGVGLSLLSMGALFTQCSLLFACCGISPSHHGWECDVSFALHHVCSAIRVLCPLLAVWCVSPVLDQLWGCGYRWRCALAVPCVVALACLVSSLYDEAPSQTMLDVAHVTVLLTWPLFVKSCWKQKPFEAIRMAQKRHKE